MSMERNEASQGSRPALSTTQQHERFEYMGELCWEGGLPSWTPFQGAASNIYTTVHVATPRHAAEEEPLTPDDETSPPRGAGGCGTAGGGALDGRGRAASDADAGNFRRRTISLGAAPSANSAIVLPAEVISASPAEVATTGAGAIVAADTGATGASGAPGAVTTTAKSATRPSLVPPPALRPPTARMAALPDAALPDKNEGKNSSEARTPKQQPGRGSTHASPRSPERTPRSRAFPSQPATDARHVRESQRRGKMSRRRQRQRQRAAAASLRKLRVLRQVIASEHFAHAVLLARRRQPHAHSLDIPVVCRKTTGSDKGRRGGKRIGGPDGIFVACGRACDWPDGVASRVLNGECEVFAIRLTTTAGIKHSASGRRNSRSTGVSSSGPAAQVEAQPESPAQSTTEEDASTPTSTEAPSTPISTRSRACSAPSLRSLSDSFADPEDCADAAQQRRAPARPALSRSKTDASGAAAAAGAALPGTTSTADTQLVQRATAGSAATPLLNMPLLAPASHDDNQRAKALETVRPPSPPAVSMPSKPQVTKPSSTASDGAPTIKRPVLGLKVKTPSLPIPLRPLPMAAASSAPGPASLSLSTAPEKTSSSAGVELSSESTSKPTMKWRPRHLRVGAGMTSKSSSCTSLEGLLQEQEAVEAASEKGKAEEQESEVAQRDDGAAEAADTVCSPNEIRDSTMTRSERGRSDSITAFAARQRLSNEPISTRLKFGASAEKGNRSSMEDEHVMLENLECHVIQQWERRAPGSATCYPWRALCSRPGSPTVDTAAIAAVAVPQGNIVGAPSDSALGAEVVARAAADAQAAEEVLETAAEEADVEAEPRWLRTLRRRDSDAGSRVGSRAPSPDDHAPQNARSTQLSAGATASVSEPQSPQTPRGRRQHAFFGVFDGHDGREAVEYVSARLPIAIVRSRHFPKRPKKAFVEAFFETDSELLKLAAENEWYSGATAVVVLISGDVLLTAHAGDSRLVLGTSRRGRGGFIELTKDHKPDRPDERARIERAGGSVTEDCDGCVRVGDVLSVARSFGDWEKDHRFHDPKTKKLLGITAEPEVGEFVLDDADEFLICACDGLWDVMQNKQAIDFCRKSLQRHGDPRRASRELSAQALRQGSTDNVSVVVVSFIERPGFRWGGGTDGEPASARRLRTTNEPGSGGGSTSGAGGGASSGMGDGSAGGSGDCAVDGDGDSHECESGMGDSAAMRPRPTRGALSAVQAAISVAGLPATPVNRSDDDADESGRW